MPFTFKLSKRLALMKTSLAASAVLTLACTSDLTDPQPHRNSLTPVAISADLTPLAATGVVASGYQDPNVPQNTLDNNLATRWSANGDGQWIRYDLGAVMAVGAVDIAWYQGTAWASAFEIQVSLDTLTWTPVFSGRSSGQTLQPERYDFSTVTGRYIQIVGHGQWSGTTLLSLWNSITEVAIYASPAAPVSSVPVAAVVASGYQDPN
ncbi:MAG TPA: discoidin domain-containing protein, partial [Gemmatimonadales bacterium]